MRNPYVIGQVEIDLRQELNNMFFGHAHEIAKANKMILRRMRRDSSDHLIPCDCVDNLTKEPDIDTTCVFCLGEGFYWDEEWVWARSVDIGSSTASFAFNSRTMPPGEMAVNLKVFYFEYTVEPSFYDRIIELKSDQEGNPVKPYKRYRIYKPQSVIPLRSDNGRIEFYAVFCSQKDSIFVDDTYNK